jgi:hypothetical protein
MKETFSLCLVAAVLMVTPIARAQDKEDEDQLKRAAEAAKKMGIKMPDMKAIEAENDKEEAKEQASQKAAAKAALEAKGPVELPAWMPKVPEFTASGPAVRKLVDGQPRTVLTGTSPVKPDALADAWEAFKAPGVGHERSGSDVNHNVDLSITLRNGEDGSEVKMEAERKAGAKVTQVTLSAPLPVATPASVDN